MLIWAVWLLNRVCPLCSPGGSRVVARLLIQHWPCVMWLMIRGALMGKFVLFFHN